jgi:membrane protease YdiL (CAAX protease family)
MMENGSGEAQAQAVPWSTRDVALSCVFLVLWWAVIGVLSLALALFDVEIDPGVFVGLAELALLLPVWWLALHKYGVGLNALGLREFGSGALGLGCGLMLLSFAFNFVYSALLGIFGLQVQTDLAPLFSELSSPWWFLLAGVVVAPVVEEVFFRGFVFAGLRSRYEWRTAAAISSALFALTHLQFTAFIPIFLLGYIFAILYRQSNSIVPAILMHVLTNGLALGTAYLATAIQLPT